jgi:hypothetical protein
VAVPNLLVEKRCSRCDEYKPHGEFWREERSKDGLQGYCKSCANEHRRGASARWTPEQRSRHRARVIKYRYGVELAVVDSLYDRQEGCCAICGVAGERPFVAEKRHSRIGVLCIDHDHEGGEVRGLLCTNCNLGIGYFHDDLATMARAMGYISRKGLI